MTRSQDAAQPVLLAVTTTRCPHCHRRVLAGMCCPAHPADAASPADAAPSADAASPGPPDDPTDPTGEVSGALSSKISDTLSGSPPGVIGDMSVVGLLGRGGFATVYLACRGDQAVAVKVAYRPGDPRLAREAEILRALGPPTTPRYVDQGTTADGHPFVVMEYVGLDSLARRLAERTHAAGEPVAVGRVLLAMCEAIERMHTGAGVVHRDLKPENIIFRPDGRVALIDFGLACTLRAETGARAATITATPQLTRPGEQLGTHHYMAPEQWAGDGSADARTDIYALGAILFEMLTGRPPYVGDLAAVRRGHTSGRCPRPSELAPVSRAVDDVVLGCLAKRPADRYQRALDVAAAFQLALSAAPIAPRDDGQTGARAHGLLRDRARIVLLALHTTAPAPAVAQLIEADDAVLARVDGLLHVVAWPWAPSVLAGLGYARRLAGRVQANLGAAGPMVVHVAELGVRHARGRVRLSGPALQQPAAWCATLGEDTRPGLWATAAAAAYLDTEPGPGDLVPLDREPPEAELQEIDPQTVALRGRDHLLAAAMSEISTALGDARPLLWTLEGEEGLGKTRVLHALARLVRSAGHAVFYLRARAERAPEAGLRTLCRLVLRLPSGPVYPGTLTAAWHALGCAPSPAGAAAVALFLGAATPDQIAPVREAPGALRQAAAGALAQALVHRARQRPLVILLDDAHWADPETLDALERATMEGMDAPLAVCASARPALFTLRPRWGDRAAASQRVILPPLDAAATRALLGDLLRPVEFVPAPVVERLHALSCGIPGHVAEVARMVRASGAIRRHRGLDGYYIAADELLAESDAPVTARLARRALAGVPTPLVPLAELCALLPGELGEVDARGIQAALCAQAQPHASDDDTAIAALCEIDVSVGLARLVRHGVLAPGAHGHRIRQPMLGQALAAAIPAARKRRLHAAVLAHGQAAGWSGDWLAHHAAQAGESALAAALYLEQAEKARARHDYVAAEEHYSGALAHAPVDSPVREAAISGRGRVRYRLQRFADALADLRRARALADARGDAAAIATLLLEEATVLDWCHAHAEAEAVATEGALRARALGEPRLLAAADLALGRMCYRREDLAAAIPLLEQAAARAADLGEHETRVIALLLLAPALAYVDRQAEAEARFEEVMAVCTAAGDEFHLAVAHINRQVLWMKQYQVDRAVADLEACIELGRRLGNAQIERPATFNLAELLYWRGDMDAALRLALRSRDMQRRFVREPVFDDALLLARILWRRDPAAAREHMDWLAEHGRREDWPPHARVLHAMMELVLATLESRRIDQAAWEALVAQAAARAFLDEHREILVTAVELACRCGQNAEARHWMARARNEAQGAQLWLGRLDDMTRAWGCDPGDHIGPGHAGKEAGTAGGA